jgi:hypothetical protein
VAEPIIPSINHIKRKYKKGTILSGYIRHLFDHSKGKSLLHAGIALLAAGVVMMPHTTSTITEAVAADVIIQTEPTLVTQKSVQKPLTNMKVNQNYSFFHPGLDLGSPVGEPVKSIRKGTVVFAGYTRDGYGNNVVVDHGQGAQSLYAHLSSIEVKAGQSVDMDTVLGRVGKSGRTTGPHLHLEVRVEGRNINPFTVITR